MADFQLLPNPSSNSDNVSITLDGTPLESIPKEVIALVPADLAQQFKLVPVHFNPERLELICAWALPTLEEAGSDITGVNTIQMSLVNISVVTDEHPFALAQIEYALKKYYPPNLADWSTMIPIPEDLGDPAESAA